MENIYGPDETKNFVKAYEAVIKPVLVKLFQLLENAEYLQIKIDVMKVLKVWS